MIRAERETSEEGSKSFGFGWTREVGVEWSYIGADSSWSLKTELIDFPATSDVAMIGSK